MIRIRFHFICCTILAFAACAGQANAQTFELAWYDSTGTNPISTINVAPNSSFTARVYMTQTTGTANYLGTIGMISMSVSLDVGSATAPVRINDRFDMVRNPLFDDDVFNNGLVLNPNDASFSAGKSNILSPVLATGGTNRIHLASITFQTGSIGTQTLVASDGPLGNLGGPTNFDLMTVASGNLNVTVVPEPSTVLLLAAGGLGLCRVIARRRKAKDAPVLAA